MECECCRKRVARYCSFRCATTARGMQHGHATKKGQSPTYVTWNKMKQRCLNSNHKHYGHYGGRGITVCERWLSFDNFLADMGERPEGMSLDRIDVNGNYEPGNCRWASHRQQLGNTRATRWIEYRGKPTCLTHLADSLDINPVTLRNRIIKGWPEDTWAVRPGEGGRPRLPRRKLGYRAGEGSR